MLAHYAHPYDRRPFWRARADDGAQAIVLHPPPVGTADTALRPRSKVLERRLLILRAGQGRDPVTAVVYVAEDDSEAHWRIFLLVAAVALVVAIKHFVEGGAPHGASERESEGGR